MTGFAHLCNLHNVIIFSKTRENCRVNKRGNNSFNWHDFSIIYIYLSVCRHTVMFYVHNSKYMSEKFHVHRVSRMRTCISLRSYGSSVLQLAGLRVVVVGLRYTAVLSFACC